MFGLIMFVAALDLVRLKDQLAIGGQLRDLPVRALDATNIDPSSVAILSWRWDVDESRRSLNLELGVMEALRLNLDALFVDLISVDQSLQGDELLRAVDNFTSLFQRFPVIAAYDVDPDAVATPERTIGGRRTDERPTWQSTIRRPWIAKEIKLYGRTLNPITYVGYVSTQGTNRATGFAPMFQKVMADPYTRTVIEVLFGRTSMYNLSDFKFILPEFAGLLGEACRVLTVNDFLLVVAVLSMHSVGETTIDGEDDLYRMQFDRIRFDSVESSFQYDFHSDIYLDDFVIARYVNRYDAYIDVYRRGLMAHEGAENRIRKALGVAEERDAAFSFRRENSHDEVARSLVGGFPWKFAFLPKTGRIRMVRYVEGTENLECIHESRVESEDEDSWSCAIVRWNNKQQILLPDTLMR
jgi:hypothetical protein